MQENPKPCPFCGSSDVKFVSLKESTKKGWHAIQCQHCFAEVKGNLYSWKKWESGIEGLKLELLEKWNRRNQK